MSRLSGRVVVLAGVALTLCTGGIAAADSSQMEEIYGVWMKESVIESNGTRQDPRWELNLAFDRSGRVSYLSRSTIEIRLTNGQTKSVIDETRIEGSWSIDQKRHVVIKLDRQPTDAEASNLRTNLNFDSKRNDAVVTVAFDRGLMRLSGLERNRKILFKKVRDL